MKKQFLRTTVALLTVGAVGTVGSAVWATDSQSPLQEVAVVAPDVQDPTDLIDGVTINTAVWRNFQLAVRECMYWKGWVYEMPPVPTWWKPAFDQDGATGLIEPSFSEPAPLNLNPQFSEVLLNNDDSFLMGLRGETIYPEYNGSREYIAHDGVNSPFFGSMPAETGGCEASARAEIVVPAREAMHQIQEEVELAVISTGVPTDALVDPAGIAEFVLNDPAALNATEEVITDNEDTVMDAGGNLGR